MLSLSPRAYVGNIVKGLYYVESTRGVSVQSSELGPPHPPPQASVAPLRTQVWGGDTLAFGEGVPDTNSDDWTETLELYMV